MQVDCHDQRRGLGVHARRDARTPGRRTTGPGIPRRLRPSHRQIHHALRLARQLFLPTTSPNNPDADQDTGNDRKTENATVTLDSLHGHVLDVCSFEQAPPATFADTYGERGKRFFEANAEVFGAFASAFVTPDDVPTELTPEVVWTAKGLAAPTAADLERRVEVLDVMGI